MSIDETFRLGTQNENLRQAWKKRLEENVIFRAALQECAAPFVSPPCTIEQGHVYLAAEFRRRMEIAEEALHEVDFPENEWKDA